MMKYDRAYNIANGKVPLKEEFRKQKNCPLKLVCLLFSFASHLLLVIAAVPRLEFNGASLAWHRLDDGELQNIYYW